MRALFHPVPVAVLAIALSMWLFDAFPADSMGYHLPFSIRFLGLHDFPDFSGVLNGRYQGFPILWRPLLGLGLISGQPRLFILPNLASLVLLIFICKRYLKLSPALTICCCFAFPVAILGFRSSLQDFFVNCLMLSAAILLLLPPSSQSVKGLPQSPFILNRDIFGFILLAIAANVKFQGLMGSVIIIGFSLFFRVRDLGSRDNGFLLPRRRLFISLAVILLIWAQPVSNIFRHGNPFYPVRLAGLNGPEPPTSSPIQYIPKLPLLTNAASYFVSVTEIDPIIRAKAGLNFRRSWHNHNVAKDGFKAAPGDYQVFILTGGSNGLLTISLTALACLSLAAEAKNINLINNIHFKVRLRLLLVSFLFAFLPQSMELRYYMLTLFVPTLVAVSSNASRWREISRYLTVAGVWFAIFSPFLVPVYFWIRTGFWINADGLLSPDLYSKLPSSAQCLDKRKLWGGTIIKSDTISAIDTQTALACHFRLAEHH